MKLVILDRDGVINQDSQAFIKTPEEWIPLPNSLESISRLSRAGWLIAVATNQSGLARGLFNSYMLKKIHEKMHKELEMLGGRIDKIFFCPHSQADRCRCRKPLSGMLDEAISYFNCEIFRKNIPVIGDSLRDLQASESAGCIPVLVLTGNGYRTLKERQLPQRTRIFRSFPKFVDFLLLNQETIRKMP